MLSYASNTMHSFSSLSILTITKSLTYIEYALSTSFTCFHFSPPMSTSLYSLSLENCEYLSLSVSSLDQYARPGFLTNCSWLETWFGSTTAICHQ